MQTTVIYERIVQVIAKIIESLGVRRPSRRVVPLALTGAVMIWTVEGNVIVSPSTARELASKLTKLADLAEYARPKDLFSKGHRN